MRECELREGKNTRLLEKNEKDVQENYYEGVERGW